MTVDMGAKHRVTGFRYIPDPYIWGPGIITRYRFELSADGRIWKTVSEGEFSNIKNNPVEQIKTFGPENARYFRLTALENAEGNSNIGYAEINIITE